MGPVPRPKKARDLAIAPVETKLQNEGDFVLRNITVMLFTYINAKILETVERTVSCWGCGGGEQVGAQNMSCWWVSGHASPRKS